MCNINIENIRKTLQDGIPELGGFSMGVYLLETLFNPANHEESLQQTVIDVADELKSEFPFFYEFARKGLQPSDIKNAVQQNLQRFISDFQDFHYLVIVGIETLILDTLAHQMPNTQFLIIPHDERIDNERLIANFPANVSLIDVREVTKFRNSKSAVISYSFFNKYGSAFVYPVVLRAVGPDVRCLYIDIVGLGIMGPYTVYPRNMTEIFSGQPVFTKKYPLI